LLKSDAGGLRMLRYQALNRLSEIIPIRAVEREDGGVDLFTDSDYLIITGQTQHLETFTISDRGVSVNNVRLENTGTVISSGSGGELRGIVDGRDSVLGGFADELNKLTSSLIFEFNRVHASGEGLTGFQSVTGQTRLDEPTVALNAAGLAFVPKHGSFDLKVTNTLTGVTTTTNIAVDLDGIGADTSLTTLKNAIDAVADVSAGITVDGQLKIDAGANFEIRFGNDTSGVLAALGINTFFTGSDAGDIGVNPFIAGNQLLFAASQGGGPSDNRNAVQLAGFVNTPLAGLEGSSLDQAHDYVDCAVVVGGSGNRGRVQRFSRLAFGSAGAVFGRQPRRGNGERTGIPAGVPGGGETCQHNR
jgi:flagellar hook-associated protein 1 FlgK